MYSQTQLGAGERFAVGGWHRNLRSPGARRFEIRRVDLIPPLAQQMLSVLLAAATQNLASQEAQAGQLMP